MIGMSTLRIEPDNLRISVDTRFCDDAGSLARLIESPSRSFGSRSRCLPLSVARNQLALTRSTE
jgi:hypothetical protein